MIRAVALVALWLATAAMGPPPGWPHPRPQPPTLLSLNASIWHPITGGLWYHLPFNDDAGHLRALLPSLTVGTLNGLVTQTRYNVSGVVRLRATVVVDATSGSPVIAAPPGGCQTPTVRLFLWGSANRGTEFERWYDVGPGTQRLQPMAESGLPRGLIGDLTNPAGWVSALGTPASQNVPAWEASKANTTVGVVFGDGCTAGHGVGMAQGTAEVVLQWVWVE